jgi:hypothetical protein
MDQTNYDYFNWLVAQIHTPPRRTYNELFSRMHNVEFVWLVPNDDNRIADGMELREEFLYQSGNREVRLEWVTFLEVLVALSRRVAFIAGGDAESWAWRLIKNINLNKCHDPIAEKNVKKIDENLYALVWRTYQPSGRGGFFPLRYPVKDQRKLEIWDQMNAYIIEMDQHDRLVN